MRLKIVSLVRKPASARPGMGGSAARAPVAMTARRKRRRLPPTSMVSGETKRPSPRKTSTPALRAPSALSTSLMPARRRRMRAMAAPKSAGRVSGDGRPAEALGGLAGVGQAREARMIPFEGTQPTFRQSPPIRWRSIRATLAPSPAAPLAETRPAVPAPITTM